MSRKAINRIKILLVEKNLSSKSLGDQIDRNESTILRWCTNGAPPPLTTLVKIAELLKVTPRELLND